MRRSRIAAAVLHDVADALGRWSKRLRRRARRYERPAPDVNSVLVQALEHMAGQISLRAETTLKLEAIAETVSAIPLPVPSSSCPCGEPVCGDMGLCVLHMSSVSSAWVRPRPQS